MPRNGGGPLAVSADRENMLLCHELTSQDQYTGNSWMYGDFRANYMMHRMRSNLICTRIRMPGLKNRIKAPRIILTLAQWSPQPHDESCHKSSGVSPHLGALLAFVDLSGRVSSISTSTEHHCGVRHLMFRSLRGILVLRCPYNAAKCRTRCLHT